LQGLPENFDLPGMTRGAKYQAVGNGVPPPMAAVIARAVLERERVTPFRLCACLCGRSVKGKALTATPACRKRMERLRRDSARPVVGWNFRSVPVTVPGPVTVTPAESQFAFS
jgi:hypothetical protein